MVDQKKISSSEIFSFLSEIPDPEIPVLNIVDLGIIRAVEGDESFLTITITPTYTGCPAMKVIEEDIISLLKERGFENIKIKTTLSPAWTTDWITEEAKSKLIAYGIAPPEKTSQDKNKLSGKAKVVTCTRCSSNNTELKSQFGSTACKSLYVCKDCKEPFDYFKCI